MKKCKHCGKPIIGRRSVAEYCHDACQKAAQEKRYRARVVSEKETNPERYEKYRKQRNAAMRRRNRGTFLQSPREPVDRNQPAVCCKRCGVELSVKRQYCLSCIKENEREERNRRKAIREHKKRNLPRDFTADDWKSALEHFGYKCAYCGKKLSDKPHREHFTPMSKGGGFTKNNIVPSCPSCNMKKKAINPLDWLVQQAHGLLAYVRVVQFLESR